MTYRNIIEELETKIDYVKEYLTILEAESKKEVNLENPEEAVYSKVDLILYQTEYSYLLNELIFVMDINTVYYNLTNIIVELNALFDKYLIATKIKVLNSDSTKDAKKEAEHSLKDNAESNDDLIEDI